MTEDLLIRNVMPLGGAATDIYIRDGRFTEAMDGKAAEEIDGRGQVALPGLVEAHRHRDQPLGRMDWFHNRVGPTRNDRILADRNAKRELGIDARRESARQVLQTLAFG